MHPNVQLRHRHHEHETQQRDQHGYHFDEVSGVQSQQPLCTHSMSTMEVHHDDLEDPKGHSDRIKASTTTAKEEAQNASKRGRLHKKTKQRRKSKRKLHQQHQRPFNVVAYIKFFLLGVVVVFLLGGGYMLYSLALRPRFVHPPKVPFLPKDFQVSVVLMNHFRPRMIRESGLLDTLLEHPHVGEVLLCHSNPRTRFTYSHAKVRNIDAVVANTERGLSLRFYYCYTEAAYEYVIILDDDQEVTALALDTLLQTFAVDTDRIVGRYGRTFDSSSWSSQNHGYNTRTVFGKVEVILTKLLVAPRAYCGNFLRYESIVQDFLPNSHPLWNGEDIFFSLVANHVNHIPFDGPYRNEAVFFGGVSEASNSLKDDDSGAHDISGNMDRHVWYHAIWTHETWVNYTAAAHRARSHTAYRGNLWSTAKQRLAQLSEQDEAELLTKFAERYNKHDVSVDMTDL
jgi:hypothetical protein